ncbi:glycosyltransferase [Phenylobacterium sp. LjRoot219]|uniref:glycosyltransferase n=1 Tax=Phenylobacterium sp. LjRoot219 TaxID=3342283 RepID=UPI003ECE697E
MAASRPVLLFCGDLGGTGVARNTVLAANALHARGVVVEVIAARSGFLADELAGPRLTVLDPPFPRPRPLALASATLQLRQEIVARVPRLVVSMGNHAHLCLWAALRGLPEFKRAYRISNDLEHGKPGSLSAWQRRATAALLAADADRLLCVSEALAHTRAFTAARRQGRVAVLPNGVNAERVRARAAAPVAEAAAPPGPPLIAAVGRLHPQKNYPALLQALAVCRAEGRELQAVIIGQGTARQRTELQRLARRLGVADLVRFTGELDNPFPLVRRASVFALLSLWEGNPNSLLEALACGTPVVAARSAGAATEILGGGAFGRLVDPADPAGIAAALIAQADGGGACVRPGDRALAFDQRAASTRFVGEILNLVAADAGLAAKPRAGWRLSDEVQILARTEGHRS